MAIAVWANPLAAQRPAATKRASPVSAELRLDAIFARVDAFHVGLGATLPAGNYVRAGIVVAGGFSRDGRSGRIDLVARFHVDPYRESRWAPYGGGGLTTRYDAGDDAHTYLMLLAGIDGPARGGLGISGEAALGGGGRIGIVLRRARAERR
ncbi:MAG: hypothetical protein ABIR58_03665 [Gemmatimonadaceae bacterium]